jgi:hypothetical protein
MSVTARSVQLLHEHQSGLKVAEAVLQWFAARGDLGGTTDECEAALALRHQSVSPRIHELTKAGRLMRTAERRLTRSGKMAIVYAYRTSDVPLPRAVRTKATDAELLSATKRYIRAKKASRTQKQVKTALVRLLTFLNRQT